jgi:glycosyltransferase involved in cell wall biosynthesis
MRRHRPANEPEMRVLHLTLSYNHGGRREAIGALAVGLAELGVASLLCCLDEMGSKQRERSMFDDAICLDRRGLFDLAALRRLRRYCRQQRIDILHAHDAASEAMAAMATVGIGLPLLMSFHRTRNFESARFRDRLRNALIGMRAGAVVTASRERQQHFIDSNWIPAAKVSCIALGIDLQRFRPDPQRRMATRARLGIGAGQVLVGTVGHFGPEKGVDLAIQAFGQYLDQHPGSDARLVVLGRGEPEHERFVRDRVAPAHADRIVFAGFQTDPDAWFPAFDVLLHGAREEAFGLVLAEAQACGVPVVAARVGGIPDVVADRHSGILADRADAGQLAQALATVLGDPALRAAMSAAAVARAHAEFGRARYAQRYLAVYRRLLTGEVPTPA